MIGQLVHSSDFQRLLSTRPWSRSTHFAVHHVAACPGDGRKAFQPRSQDKLSTGVWEKSDEAVDDFGGQHWLGAVLPKRLARRAVTRNLLRRQIRAAMQRHQASLPGGLWLVRLRQGFARTEFVSAASEALRRTARAELDQVLTLPAPAGARGAVARPSRSPGPC